jgi:hypothetical protein
MSAIFLELWVISFMVFTTCDTARPPLAAASLAVPESVLARLAQEQVVTIQPNKGASVAEPTVDEAREVFEARTVVEAVLVRRFVARAKAADLKALADCIEQEEAARLAGEQAMALRLSGQFHLLLAEVAEHQTFARFLHRLVSRTSLILMRYAPVERTRLDGSALPVRWVQACLCDEHRGLLNGRTPEQASLQRVRTVQAHGGELMADPQQGLVSLGTAVNALLDDGPPLRAVILGGAALGGWAQQLPVKDGVALIDNVGARGLAGVSAPGQWPPGTRSPARTK